MHTVEILNITDVTHDVKKFTVKKPDKYDFIPGQATNVAVNADGFRDMFRPFTFTSLNSDTNLEFIIKSYPLSEYPDHTGVTEKLHTLTAHDGLMIQDPFGAITYKGPGTFIAGGAGITPFLAIFKDLASKDELEGNSLIFSNKTSKDIIMEKELRKWFEPEDLVLTLTREKEDGYYEGRIDRDVIKSHTKDFTKDFYVCGPMRFVDDITQTLTTLGADPDSVIIEK